MKKTHPRRAVAPQKRRFSGFYDNGIMHRSYWRRRVSRQDEKIYRIRITRSNSSSFIWNSNSLRVSNKCKYESTSRLRESFHRYHDMITLSLEPTKGLLAKIGLEYVQRAVCMKIFNYHHVPPYGFFQRRLKSRLQVKTYKN